MTPWDRLLFGRVVALTGVLLAAAGCVLVATDEPTSTTGDRIARLAALAPVLAALSVTVLASASRRSGEALALAAVGASPLRTNAGLVAGSAFAGLALASLVCAGQGALGALFPRLRATAWSPSADGFSASAAGVAVDRAGQITFSTATSLGEPALPRTAVCLTLITAAVLLPAWAALPASGAPRLVVAAAATVVAVCAFHAVAAGAPAAWLFAALALPAAHMAHLLRPTVAVWSRLAPLVRPRG